MPRGDLRNAFAKARARVQVVEADRDAGPCPGRNDVVRRIADLEVGDLQIGRLEPIGAFVEHQRVEFGEQGDEPRERVVGKVRISDVAFAALDLEPDVDRATPANLHRIAEFRDRRRLADQA